MIQRLKHFLLDNWQRKLIALILAVIVWFLINHSITITRTIAQIPVKVINLPQNKTIDGLLPSGFLDKRITLTVTGSKDVVQELNSGNLQVVVDAEGKGDQWIAHVDKKSLVSLIPDIDLSRSLSEVSQNTFVIRLSPLVTAKIPITILPPIGEPPPGFQYLDIWPSSLVQTVSGSEEEIEELRTKGLQLVFDLSKISLADLQNLNASGEVSFIVPESWKKIDGIDQINDPNAPLLRIDLLHRTLLPLNANIPLSIFFPLQTADAFNPEQLSLVPSEVVENTKGIFYLKLPLLVKGVSSTFLDIVQGHIEIVIVASKDFPWSVQFVAPDELENRYAAENPAQEEYLRSRFRAYMRAFELFTLQEKKLALNVEIAGSKILVQDLES